MSEPGIATEVAAPVQLPVVRQAPRWLVIVLACLFAGLIPETILTSSTSVLKIVVNPLAVVYIGVFYGTAMLILREVIIRKPASWVSVVLFGVAFGCCNEGVVAGTWYTMLNPGYLFFGPVVIAWAVALTVFHLFVSMLVTVSFTDILFPSYAGRSLLGRRGITITAAIFILFTALAFFALTFRLYRVLVFAAAMLLAIIAVRLPGAQRSAPVPKAPPRLWVLRIAGFLAYLLYFVDIYFLPRVTAGLPHVALMVAQYMDITLSVVFSAIVLQRGLTWQRRDGWGLRHNLALITGAVIFAALAATVSPNELIVLEPLAIVPFLLFLLWQGNRLKRLQARTA